MQQTAIEKKELRKKVKLLKGNYSTQQKRDLSEIILHKLEVDNRFINSNIVMLYWSMDDEVFTHNFVEKYYGKKRIILPVVDGDNLLLKEYKGKECLVAGDKYGILEPDGPVFETPELIDLIVVPGVAFDKDNNRMGRGKAYYDKFLRTSDATKIGICFNFQYFETVPTDIYDIKMDCVIC
jgi:5-formyltetrahydrofolate cyclo-ligase